MKVQGQSEGELPVSAAPHTSSGWWHGLLVINILMWILYGMLICGCHFHPLAVPVGLIPVAWALFLIVKHRKRRVEKLVPVALLTSAFWIWWGWDSNVQFYFFQ